MDLAQTYQTNIRSIYDRVLVMYQRGQPFYETDVTVPKLTPLPPPTEVMNRAFYLWTLKCIHQLQDVINALIKVYNDNGIIDYEVGDTPTISLWLPRRLKIDDFYTQQLAADFKQCNDLLDQLNEYLQPFLVE